MTSLADAYFHIKFNPFKFSKHIACFYGNLIEVKENLLLCHIIIPICTHPTYSKKLTNAKFGASKQSSFLATFQNREELYDFQDRIDELKDLTYQALQYALMNDWLQINTIKMQVTAAQKPQLNSDPAFRCARNLGRMLSHHSATEIYAILGITPQ